MPGAVVREVGNRLIDRSPVGAPETWKKKPPADYKPGHFRSNWRLGVDQIDVTFADQTNVFVVNGLDRIPANPFGHRYFLSNAAPYAWRIEVDHWSTQAPAGVVGITAMEWPSIVMVATAEVKRINQGVVERYE